MNRRTFLKAAGVTALALGGGQALRSAFARGEGGQPVDGAQGTGVASNLALTASRWAMLVDTTRCKAREGCRDCRRACHQAHNVPEIPERRHEIKWVWTEPFKHTFPGEEHEFMAAELIERPVLVMCNHCDNPPCVRVCPTRATFKRADGIVMMDWHRCIGCRYCVVGCPYGSRSFNWRDPRPFIAARNPEFPTRTRGVVEKCNFCDERLARGLLPACVAACKQRALVFGDLDRVDGELRRLLRAGRTLRRKPALGTGPKIFYVV